MAQFKCNHIRIADNKDDDLRDQNDVEQYIKCIEERFNVNFTALPNYKQLMKLLFVRNTDIKRSIQNAKLRKHLIVQKLYKEFTNLPLIAFDKVKKSPGTDKAKDISSDESKTSSELSQSQLNELFEGTKSEEMLGIEENISFPDIVQTKHNNSEKQYGSENINLYKSGQRLFKLPYYISLNEHKDISPRASSCSTRHLKSVYNVKNVKKDIIINTETGSLKETSLKSSIECLPNVIVVAEYELAEQCLKFTLRNVRAKSYMYIRFVKVTNQFPFKRVNVSPDTPVKLYPGMATVYKLKFNLTTTKKEFCSEIQFKLGFNIYEGKANEDLFIPFESRYVKARSVSVTQIVHFPSLYFWHFPKDGVYPKEIVKVSVNDDHYYHLHIVKKEKDFYQDTENYVDLMTPCENDLMQSPSTNVNSEILIRVNTGLRTSTSRPATSQSSISNDVMVSSIVSDMANIALDSIVFDDVYYLLEPHSEVKLPVYFTKMEHVGCYNYHYDFQFYDFKSNELIAVKTTRIFAEILPNPVQVHPLLLDMSMADFLFGYREEAFVLTNSNKIYPVTVRIKLSPKMKKVFYIEPMKTVVPTSGSVSFKVRYCPCASGEDMEGKEEYLSYFVIEIHIFGYEPVYRNVPPICYEIVAPSIPTKLLSSSTID